MLLVSFYGGAMTARARTAREALYNFLCEAFTSEEIDKAARFGPGRPTIVNSLSQEAAHGKVVSQYLNALESRKLIDDDFWDYLQKCRPTRSFEISNLRIWWNGGKPSPETHPPPNKATPLRTIEITDFAKFRFARQTIVTGKGEPILLVGDHRSGKTSWMRQMQTAVQGIKATTEFPGRVRRPTELITQFIDNQSDMGALTVEKFWSTAFAAVHRWATRHERDVLARETKNIGQLASDHKLSHITSLMGSENLRLVLFIDNFDRIWESQDFRDSDLLFRLRYVVETSQRTLSLVASSRRDITTMNRLSRARFQRGGSPLFNYFKEYFLGSLTRSKFLSSLDGETFDQQDRRFLYMATGGSYHLSRQLQDAMIVARGDVPDLIKSRCLAAHSVLEANDSTFHLIWEDWTVVTRHALFLILVKQVESTLTQTSFFSEITSVTPLDERFKHGPELRTLRRRGIIDITEDEYSQQVVAPQLFFWWFVEQLSAYGFSRAQDCVNWLMLNRISEQALKQLEALLTTQRQTLLNGDKMLIAQSAANP